MPLQWYCQSQWYVSETVDVRPWKIMLRGKMEREEEKVFFDHNTPNRNIPRGSQKKITRRLDDVGKFLA